VFSVVPFDNVTFQVVEGSIHRPGVRTGTAPATREIAVKDHTAGVSCCPPGDVSRERWQHPCHSFRPCRDKGGKRS
jgi:hypothetical protein